MKRIFILLSICITLGFFLVPMAYSHTPLCPCYDNGDETVTCEGGFSDGSSSAGVLIRIVDEGNKVLIEGKMDEDGEFTFVKLAGPYKVIFDAGPGHAVEIGGEDITE